VGPVVADTKGEAERRDEAEGGASRAQARGAAERQAVRRLVALLAALSLSGCATAINGFDQRVSFDSAPKGAQVRVTRIDMAQERTALEGRCETPCSMVLTRGPDYRVRFSKDGCGPVNVRLYPKFDTAFYYAIAPEFMIDTPYDIAPNPVKVNMTCGMEVTPRAQ
jgi:hypothetical protein